MAESPIRRTKGLSGFVVLLALLALWDLRVELQLLVQHFTFTELRAAVLAHPLAIAVLLLLPSLQQRLGGSERRR